MSPVESPRIFQKSSEMLEDLSHGTSWPRETKLVDIFMYFHFSYQSTSRITNLGGFWRLRHGLPRSAQIGTDLRVSSFTASGPRERKALRMRSSSSVAPGAMSSRSSPS